MLYAHTVMTVSRWHSCGAAHTFPLEGTFNMTSMLPASPPPAKQRPEHAPAHMTVTTMRGVSHGRSSDGLVAWSSSDAWWAARLRHPKTVSHTGTASTMSMPAEVMWVKGRPLSVCTCAAAGSLAPPTAPCPAPYMCVHAQGSASAYVHTSAKESSIPAFQHSNAQPSTPTCEP